MDLNKPSLTCNTMEILEFYATQEIIYFNRLQLLFVLNYHLFEALRHLSSGYAGTTQTQ